MSLLSRNSVPLRNGVALTYITREAARAATRRSPNVEANLAVSRSIMTGAILSKTSSCPEVSLGASDGILVTFVFESTFNMSVADWAASKNTTKKLQSKGVGVSFQRFKQLKQ